VNIGRASAIALKEVRHILRDPFTLGLAILMPVIFVAVFGLAIEFNVKNIPVAVSDADKSSVSRQLVDVMGSSRFFVPFYVSTPNAAIGKINANAAKVALIIDKPFSRELALGKTARVQLLLDGSDSSTISSTVGYLASIGQHVASRVTGTPPQTAVTVKTRFLYNPELNSRWFSIPGLTVLILAVLSVLLTALTVAREWENGSMELLLSTPAQPLDIIIGKLIPYLGMGLIAVAAVYLLARVGMNVPFRGSHAVFLLGCLLFLVTCLAQGLLISVLTRSQRLAMQLGMIIGLMPSALLSGFIFPIESMPPFFRGLTAILPARWFMVICRDVFLKGSSLYELRVPFLTLTLFAVVLVTLSTTQFKKDVEP